MTRKIACFTGHRPESLPWGNNKESFIYDDFYDKLEMQIDEAIADGFSHFITGMARGIDLMAAEILLKKREENENLILEAAIPFRNQAAAWNIHDRDEYFDILERVDTQTFVSENYFRGCMQKRNEYMVDSSQRLIAVYNGQSGGGTRATMGYAIRKGCEIRTIKIDEEHFYDNFMF